MMAARFSYGTLDYFFRCILNCLCTPAEFVPRFSQMCFYCDAVLSSVWSFQALYMAIPIETNVYRVQKSIPPKCAPSAETIAPMITSIAPLLSDDVMTAIIDNIVPLFDKNVHNFLLAFVEILALFLRNFTEEEPRCRGERRKWYVKSEKKKMHLKIFSTVANNNDIVMLLATKGGFYMAAKRSRAEYFRERRKEFLVKVPEYEQLKFTVEQ